MSLPILCIESNWDGRRVSKRSISYLLNLVSAEYGVPVVHLIANTEEELVHNLKNFNYGFRRGILYLSFHGRPGVIKLGNQTLVPLETLAQHMNRRFGGWYVHFGSCATVNVEVERMIDFKLSTQVRMVSGYTTYVDWVENAAMDLILLGIMQNYTYRKNIINKITNDYSELRDRTGLELI